MGRQSAGKAFMKGVARHWPHKSIAGIGPDIAAGKAMFNQLKNDGFQGQIQWSTLPDFSSIRSTGNLYYPAPPSKAFAIARNFVGTDSFSIFGVTHTLSSHNATDQIADLILPPYQPWDALICTSNAAKSFVSQLHDEMREYWRTSIGAQRFNSVLLPIIPLGVDVPSFSRPGGVSTAARKTLGIGEDEVAFLFAGRLSFHAKANPAPVYQALEVAAQSSRVVFIEAGVFPNKHIHESYVAAQKALAPSVRFIWVDGKDADRYLDAWKAADVFVSLSDNIQETYGLTPLEAMAAGLPVIVSDWDGYKDTVRDGIDGFRIPTIAPSPGSGVDLALRHTLELDTYDFYIGRASLATVIHSQTLAEKLTLLCKDSKLRKEMGEAGARRAVNDFDWPVILTRYEQLCTELASIRQLNSKGGRLPLPPNRSDPFSRFLHYPTETLSEGWRISAHPNAEEMLKVLSALSMANYAFNEQSLNQEILTRVLKELGTKEPTVRELLTRIELTTPAGYRSLMWLWKFGVISIRRVGQ